MIPREEVIKAYRDDLVPMITLAKQHSVSRQAIYKVLKNAGVATGKSNRIKRPCGWCGKPVSKVRCQARTRKRFFCDQDCYFEWMDSGGEYVPSRTGQRIGRAVVSKYFELLEGYVVHHEDRTQLNNLPWNLKVFVDHSTHMKYHFQKRGNEKITVEILWDGSDMGRTTYLESANPSLGK